MQILMDKMGNSNRKTAQTLNRFEWWNAHAEQYIDPISSATGNWGLHSNTQLSGFYFCSASLSVWELVGYGVYLLFFYVLTTKAATVVLFG